jgi:hypothetical protein
MLARNSSGIERRNATNCIFLLIGQHTEQSNVLISAQRSKDHDKIAMAFAQHELIIPKTFSSLKSLQLTKRSMSLFIALRTES